jgi:RNA-directed DNA polymerase
MIRQKSERRVVAQAPRKLGSTEASEKHRGAKATSVNEQSQQLGLHFGTADNAYTQVDAVHRQVAARARAAAKPETPLPKFIEQPAAPATIEAIVMRLHTAFKSVASNQGAAGPDRQSVIDVREHIAEVLPVLAASLLNGTYAPGDIRRVWIPKAGGGERGLGIPNVVDRVVQEAIRQELEPVYEPTFHASSHGFRPGRSCHTAIASAKQYIEDGYEWVVDIDLEKFFDKVHHQRLMAKLAQRIGDKRLLVLLGKMLKAAVVLPNGVRVSTDEGVPQGGPLSPLLSNIVLTELDNELEQRGLRFARYADDCNIYVRSERAGQRVMASITAFIEKRLRLKVNAAKSAVAKPEERHFVGFRLQPCALTGVVDVLLSKRSRERIDSKVRELTPRSWGSTLDACIQQLNVYLRGWLGFFGNCTSRVESTLSSLDAHIRRRLRAIQLKHWKRKYTIAKRLIQLGIKPIVAWRSVYEGRKSFWALSHLPSMHRALRNAYFAERGLYSLKEHWRLRQEQLVAPGQLLLPLG